MKFTKRFNLDVNRGLYLYRQPAAPTETLVVLHETRRDVPAPLVVILDNGASNGRISGLVPGARGGRGRQFVHSAGACSDHHLVTTADFWMFDFSQCSGREKEKTDDSCGLSGGEEAPTTSGHYEKC